MTIAIKEVKSSQKQSMLLTKEEIRLIERIRQLCRKTKPCLIIVRPEAFLSWYVAEDKES
jgi:hypothetical protein